MFSYVELCCDAQSLALALSLICLQPNVLPLCFFNLHQGILFYMGSKCQGDIGICLLELEEPNDYLIKTTVRKDISTGLSDKNVIVMFISKSQALFLLPLLCSIFVPK